MTDQKHQHTHMLTVYLSDDDQIELPIARPNIDPAVLAKEYAARLRGDAGLWGLTGEDCDQYVIIPARSIRFLELVELDQSDAAGDDPADPAEQAEQVDDPPFPPADADRTQAIADPVETASTAPAPAPTQANPAV